MIKYHDYWSYLSLSLAKLFFFSWLTATAFDFSFFLINLATILLLTSWALAVSYPIRRWILYVSLFLHSTLLVSDVWYYRYFEDLLSVALLSDIGQMGDVGGGFLTLIRPIDAFFFIDLIIYGLILRYMKRHPVREGKRNGRRLALAGFTLGFLLFTIPLTLSYQRGEKWIADDPISNMREYYHLGFWGYHAMDVARGVERAMGWNEALTEEERSQIQALSYQELSAPSPDTNVIVLQLESFQTSVIDQQIDGQELTPNLNRLRRDMLYFPNVYHQTHEGRTSDAEFIVNTSLYPVKSGSVYTRFPGNQFSALSQFMNEAGYDTAAMHSFRKDFWNRDDFYDNIGFNHFFSDKDYPDQGIIGMALNDQEFLNMSIGFMEELDEPFYTFLVALTSHTPYDIPEDEKRLDLSDIDDPLLENYYHTVHFVDAAVGQFIERLKRDGLWDETLLVMYGDHDSGLTAPGDEMATLEEVDSTVDAFQLDRAVPLFIKPPGLTTGEVMEASGGQIDIAPTILDLLGISPAYMLGDSLLNDTSNLTVFRTGAFRYEDHYYEPDLTERAGNGTCYSIETEEQVAFDRCAPYIDRAASQLRLSDTIIEKDALSQMSP
ncbi:MAG: LTA synthase family protein [Exiguobacterium sp.]|nr:LTA synthase family protein [Exiguobacterium sp.]